MLLNHTNKVQVALVLYDHMLSTSVSLPVEMLRAGEAFAVRKNKSVKRLSIEMVSENMQPVVTRALIKLLPDKTVEQANHPDFIFIPSLWRNPRPLIKKYPKMIKWLADSWKKGATLVGGGTGVCFMAESGVLDNLPATTHWHYVEQFQRDYPKVALKPDFFITQSERMYCAASLNALADIVVHIIHQTYGEEAAQHVERNFSHEIRKPYAEQRYLEGDVDRHPDELITQVQFWMRTNLSSSLSLLAVATNFSISQRTLTRRFKAATGVQPSEYWKKLRLESAQDLLSSSNLSIQEIAFQVGFQDQANLTRLFKQTLNLTPRDYRATVRKKLFSQ
jgi:transcriptional regulator GlxA family with amidase domain